MSDFDNNGFETGDNINTEGTVENAETTSYTDTSSYDGSQSYTAPDYNYTAANEPANDSKVFGIISLVCGIVSLLCSCCGWIGIILSVAAVVLGILSIKKEENAKGMAIAGIVCGGVGLLIGIIVTIMGAAVSSMDPDALTEYVERFEDSL